VLLHLIAAKPSHGYELIKAIEERTQGAYSPSPGAVYPTLTLLEELGYITLDDSDGQRRLCQVTDEGRKFLAENQAIVTELESRLSRTRGRSGDGEIAAPIVRAMENLHTALRLRLGAEALGKDQVHSIAATLDAAATAIEQI
jgi:DNA-binding PadR family transcriptional regulator